VKIEVARVAVEDDRKNVEVSNIKKERIRIFAIEE